MLIEMQEDLMTMMKRLYSMAHHPSATADQSNLYQSIASDLVDAHDKIVSYTLLESVWCETTKH